MKISQRQIVAEIQPVTETGHQTGPRFNDPFAQVSGGEISSAVDKVYDGASRLPDVLCAPSEIGDVSITRHFDPDRDGRALKKIRQLVGQVRYDLTVYTLNCDLEEAGSQRIYPKALLVGLTEPDGDSSSGAPSTFSMTFSIGQIAADVDPG